VALEAELLRAFVGAHPSEAANALESMGAEEASVILRALPAEMSGTLLPYLPVILSARSLERLSAEQAASIVSAARRDVAATVLRTMASQHRLSVVASLAPDVGRSLKPLLRFAEGTAGALMDTQVLTVPESATVAEALEKVRREPADALYYVYVVDTEQRLVGVANMRELLASRPEQRVGLFAARVVESLPGRATSHANIAHTGWRRLHALPIIDAYGRFVGVIRYASVRELEGRQGRTATTDPSEETAAALGEVYGLGLKGLFEWMTSLLFGSDTEERRL
jgi:magnesium transporter